jgi:hypothetical protein
MQIVILHHQQMQERKVAKWPTLQGTILLGVVGYLQNIIIKMYTPYRSIMQTAPVRLHHPTLHQYWPQTRIATINQ